MAVLVDVPTIELNWHPGAAAVIDNWAMLHGRGLARTEHRERVLLRLAFY